MRLTRAAIHKGRHPALWKWASSVVIRKPAKDHYTTLNGYSSISLHRCMANVVEKVSAEQLSEEAERWGLPSNCQFGSRKGRSLIDAVAILVDRAHAAGTHGHITGELLMHIMATFPIVAKMKTSHSDEDQANGKRS